MLVYVTSGTVAHVEELSHLEHSLLEEWGDQYDKEHEDDHAARDLLCQHLTNAGRGFVVRLTGASVFFASQPVRMVRAPRRAKRG